MEQWIATPREYVVGAGSVHNIRQFQVMSDGVNESRLRYTVAFFLAYLLRMKDGWP